VNPITGKVKLSNRLRRYLGLEEGGRVGFGYDPDSKNPTRAALYVIETTEEDNSGCAVTAGQINSIFHSEKLDVIYNGAKATIFTATVSETPEEIQGTSLYWISAGGEDSDVVEETTDQALPAESDLQAQVAPEHSFLNEDGAL
jgi:hypothetical protein